MADIRKGLKISDKGILKNVANQKQNREATMLQLFGTPQEKEMKEMKEKEQKRKEALKKQLEKKNN